MKTKNGVLTKWVLLIFLLLAGCNATESIPTTGNLKPGMGSFDRAMLRLMEKWGVPGGALTVLKEGEVVLSRGYGYADIEQKELVQPDSLFRIASISKPLTAVAVLQLMEEGKFQLETPAFQILDHLRPPAGIEIDPRFENITIQHLLEHTGGWDSSRSPDPMFMAREIGLEMGLQGPADCKSIIEYMLGQPLDFAPGSQYAYSNFGYCVLGQVIEVTSGLNYEKYVQTHILEPLGIKNMQLGSTQLPAQLPGEVHYYAGEENTQSVFGEDGELVPRPYGGFYLEAMDAHGGWVGSATDLVVFASALEGNSGDSLLKPESLTLILSPSETYSYGVKVRTSGKGMTWWATGSMPGTTAILYHRSDGIIWAALFNANPDSSSDAFLVDIITEMGKAAMIDKFFIGFGALLTLAVVFAGIILIRKRRKS